MHWNWISVCGANDSLVIWDHGQFGPCFEALGLVCTTHALLAITSAFNFARHQHRRIRGTLPLQRSLHLRLLISLLLLLCPLLMSALILLYEKIEPTPVQIITWCVQGCTWLMHSAFVWRLRRLFHIHIRGPTTTFLTYLLAAATDFLHMRSAILQIEHSLSVSTKVEQAFAFVKCFLHLCYLLSLIQHKRPNFSSGLANSANVNSNEEESRSLLGDTMPTSYGSIPSRGLGHGVDKASWLSRLLFCWVHPLLVHGSRGLLGSPSNLFSLPEKLNTDVIDQQMRQMLGSQHACLSMPEQNLDYANSVGDARLTSAVPPVEVISSQTQPRLLSCLNKAFGWHFYPLGLLKFLCDALGFCGPLLLNLLVTYIEKPQEPTKDGYFYAAALFGTTFLGALLSSHFNYQIGVVGLRMRAAVISSVYRKALGVSAVSLSRFSSGEVVNFMSSDVDRMVNFCGSFHQFWSLPVQVGIALWLLQQQLGLAFLAGLAVTVLLVPINRCIAIKIGQLSERMMQQKDARVKVMNEVLSGIRVIKFFAWEETFARKILGLRAAELDSLKGRKYLDALCVYFWATTPVLISLLSFMTYALLGNQLTAAKVFTSMALFAMLIMPLNAFPWVLNGLIEAWVSLRRVEGFLMLPDLQLRQYYTPSTGSHTEHVIQINNGHFTWSADSSDSNDLEAPSIESRTQDLCNLHLAIPKGALVGVVGEVGSGKSSLINCLLAELRRVQGCINMQNVEHGFALCTQEPWLQHASIRDNILFGLPMSARRYQQVLSACALEEDVGGLPGGDRTEVGERGVTLSGGQKARIALARAVYQDKDICLLDDPLSAVDAHVAQHLFEKCIMGMLRNRTRILATHHTHYLRHADLVVVMDHGRIVQCGPPAEITVVDLDADNLRGDSNKRKSSESDEEVCDDEDEEQTNVAPLIEDEEREEGAVKLSVYGMYWKSVGKCLSPLILLAILLMQASRNVSDWWLSFWVTHSLNSSDHSTLLSLEATSSPMCNIVSGSDNVEFYLIVYGALAGGNTLFTLLRAFLFAYGGICAATAIHRELLHSILKAPVGFFDVTPLGRVMNRFSTDVYCVDDSLPFLLNILLAQTFSLLGTVVVCCYGLPWILILLVPLTFVYYYIQKFYRQTSRDLKRLASVSLSPVYAHFAETVCGVGTIRALRQTHRFEEENRAYLDANQRAQFAGCAVAQWLGLRLQLMGVAMVTGVAFIAVLQHHFHTANPGLIGLAISYALGVTGQLSGVVTMFTETEKQMVSVERAEHYSHHLPHERQRFTLNAPPFWPLQGTVTFQRVCLQFRPGLPSVLQNVTFETKPIEKVGIVGRTGSGKSTLFQALFRLTEIQSGSICVDGINIGHLQLNDLRSRLAIIPQDPFLFSGTIRDNLDPTHCRTSSEVWAAVEKCHMKPAIERLGGLGAVLAEAGRPLSLGQRQLLCLARAMLSSAKVICIDEATACVDLHTDQLLQATIRSEFAQHTVLTIAHRIRSILNSDRVLVMNEGHAVEFESPTTLLQNPRSLFYSLVHAQNNA